MTIFSRTGSRIEHKSKRFQEVKLKVGESVPARERVSLSADGSSYTPTAAFEWTSTVVHKARAMLTAPITAQVWAYDNPCDCIALDLNDGAQRWFAITFLLCGESCYESDGNIWDDGAELLCTDAIEGLHLAGMIARGLGVQVEIGCCERELNTDIYMPSNSTAPRR